MEYIFCHKDTEARRDCCAIGVSRKGAGAQRDCCAMGIQVCHRGTEALKNTVYLAKAQGRKGIAAQLNTGIHFFPQRHRGTKRLLRNEDTVGCHGGTKEEFGDVAAWRELPLSLCAICGNQLYPHCAAILFTFNHSWHLCNWWPTRILREFIYI